MKKTRLKCDAANNKKRKKRSDANVGDAMCECQKKKKGNARR